MFIRSKHINIIRVESNNNNNNVNDNDNSVTDNKVNNIKISSAESYNNFINNKNTTNSGKYTMNCNVNNMYDNTNKQTLYSNNINEAMIKTIRVSASHTDDVQEISKKHVTLITIDSDPYKTNLDITTGFAI